MVASMPGAIVFSKIDAKSGFLPIKHDYEHLVTDQGLQPDPEKVRAVRSMPVPGSKEDVRRFLGFVQYLSKFIPNMSTGCPTTRCDEKKCRFLLEQATTEKLR